METYFSYFKYSEYALLQIVEFAILLLIFLYLLIKKRRNGLQNKQLIFLMLFLMILSSIYTFIMIYIYYYEYIHSKFIYAPTFMELQIYYSETETVLYPFLLNQAIIIFLCLTLYVCIYFKLEK